MSRASGLFITATDTGVGKTVVTGAIGGALQRSDRTVAVLKPVQSGHVTTDPAGDTMRLRSTLELETEPETINVYAYDAPLAPLAAARKVGDAISLGAIVARAESLADNAEVLLVEGAGGLLVPVGEAWTIADLALALGFPLVVVARAGLGTVNHALLTVRTARSLGLRVAAVVLNNTAAEEDASVATNAALISEFGDVPVLGPLPWLGDNVTDAAIRGDLSPLFDAERICDLARDAR